MRLLGLTGGVAMGKTTVAGCLAACGCSVVDTDVLAREVVEPGEPALLRIREAFGSGVIGADGRLRRAALAELVFADSRARQQLEAILHPPIRERWQATVREWHAESRSHGVVVIPLLFETGAAAEFDAVICVACTEGTQAERLAARGWSIEQSRQRVAAQWPVSRKLALASHVVWTEGTLEVARVQVERLFARIS